MQQFLEDVLADLSLLWRGSSSEMVKAYVKPLIHLPMDFVVLVTYLLGAALLFQGFGLRRRAVLIGTGDIEGIVSPETAVPSKDIGAQDAADDVAEVGDIVNIWQGTGDEDVSLSWYWELGDFLVLLG